MDQYIAIIRRESLKDPLGLLSGHSTGLVLSVIRGGIEEILLGTVPMDEGLAKIAIRIKGANNTMKPNLNRLKNVIIDGQRNVALMRESRMRLIIMDSRAGKSTLQKPPKQLSKQYMDSPHLYESASEEETKKHDKKDKKKKEKNTGSKEQNLRTDYIFPEEKTKPVPSDLIK